MKSSRYIGLVIAFAFNMLCDAQEPEFYYKHYSYDFIVNPAITGRDYYPVVNFSQRKYWFGVNDSPTSTAVGAVMRMGMYNFYTPKMLLNKSSLLSKSRMGLGAFAMYEQNGPLGYLHTSFNYAYFIPFNKGTDQLSFGLSAQIFHYSIDEQMLDPLDPGDMQLMNLDNQPYIPEAGFGVYFHNNQLSVGASLNNILKSDVSLTSDYDQQNRRDFFIHLGYRFFLKHFDFEPSIFTGYIDDNPLYYFGQVKAYYLNYNWLAIGYRSNKMLSYALGLKFNRFQVVYRFEHSVTESFRYFNGSHEIMIGVNIGLYEAEGIRKLAR